MKTQTDKWTSMTMSNSKKCKKLKKGFRFACKSLSTVVWWLWWTLLCPRSFTLQSGTRFPFTEFTHWVSLSSQWVCWWWSSTLRCSISFLHITVPFVWLSNRNHSFPWITFTPLCWPSWALWFWQFSFPRSFLSFRWFPLHFWWFSLSLWNRSTKALTISVRFSMRLFALFWWVSTSLRRNTKSVFQFSFLFSLALHFCFLLSFSFQCFCFYTLWKTITNKVNFLKKTKKRNKKWKSTKFCKNW